jgi:hypothetical protein
MNENTNSPVQTGISVNAPTAQNSVAMVFQTREMVETLGMMQMARMNPRDPEVVRARLKKAAQNENLAVAAEYIYVKGGTEVTGLSIRAAEALARAFGNVEAGCRELDMSDKETICQAYCWDMETNSRFAEVFHVPHSRTRGKWEDGRRVGTEVVPITDQRELDELTRSRGSRIKRACILAAIPVDIQEEFAEECERTLSRKLQRMVTNKAQAKTADGDEGAEYTIKDFIEEMLTTLAAKYGVSRRMVCDRFQKKAEADLANLDNRQVVMLLRIMTGLRDGIATPADYFKGASTERAVVMVGAPGKDGSTRNAVKAALDAAKNAQASGHVGENVPSATTGDAGGVRGIETNKEASDAKKAVKAPSRASDAKGAEKPKADGQKDVFELI